MAFYWPRGAATTTEKVHAKDRNVYLRASPFSGRNVIEIGPKLSLKFSIAPRT